MKIADEMLRQYQVAGILIGGLAKEIWSGSNDAPTFLEHKDVDVLILSYECSFHPCQWEGGIDWWIRHGNRERPSNGTDVGLLWQVDVRAYTRVSAGLYLCPRGLLKASTRVEYRVFGDESEIAEDATFLSRPRFNLIPIVPTGALEVHWADSKDPVAEYCSSH